MQIMKQNDISPKISRQPKNKNETRDAGSKYIMRSWSGFPFSTAEASLKHEVELG